MISKRTIACLGLIALSAAPAFAQERPIESYLRSKDAQAIVPKTTRTIQEVRRVLPRQQVSYFVEFVRVKWGAGQSWSALRKAVEEGRLDKVVAAGGGPQGVTSLVSKGAVPGLVGFGTEWGSILQSDSGSTHTLRANLLGLGNVVAGVTGAQQFPYCPESDQKSCHPYVRWLRRVSVSGSYEDTLPVTSAGTAVTATSPTPVAVDLLGGGYRLSSWSARFDLSRHDPDDSSYAAKWDEAMNSLSQDSAAGTLSESINLLFADSDGNPRREYMDWQARAESVLQHIPPDEFPAVLETQLDQLVGTMMADPTFRERLASVSRAQARYFSARDNLLKEIQSHRMSLQYTERRPADQPRLSNVQFIYSHQPTVQPTVFTVNFAVTWYTKPNALVSNRVRDVQLAASIDRRLGEIGSFGHVVATFAVYGQQMIDDALIEIGPGNVAPGSGIELAGSAARLLGTKGRIGVAQFRLTVPASGVVKIPLSVTWGRSELVPEKSWRGQVGFTLDFDSLLKK